jgi:hypothetical protein
MIRRQPPSLLQLMAVALLLVALWAAAVALTAPESDPAPRPPCACPSR